MQWQSDRQYNIGLDATLFGNKVSFTADYFNKKTTDLLFPTQPLQPAAPGAAITWKNLDGAIVNKGFEFAISSPLINQKNFGIELSLNATFIKTKFPD